MIRLDYLQDNLVGEVAALSRRNATTISCAVAMLLRGVRADIAVSEPRQVLECNLETVTVYRDAWSGCRQLLVGSHWAPTAYLLVKQSTDLTWQCYCNHRVSFLCCVYLTVLHICMCHMHWIIRRNVYNVKCLERHRSVKKW